MAEKIETGIALAILAGTIVASYAIHFSNNASAPAEKQPVSVCPQCPESDSPECSQNSEPLVRFQGTAAELDNGARW